MVNQQHFLCLSCPAVLSDYDSADPEENGSHSEVRLPRTLRPRSLLRVHESSRLLCLTLHTDPLFPQGAEEEEEAEQFSDEEAPAAAPEPKPPAADSPAQGGVEERGEEEEEQEQDEEEEAEGEGGGGGGGSKEENKPEEKANLAGERQSGDGQVRLSEPNRCDTPEPP